jgi:hypothetical protein
MRLMRDQEAPATRQRGLGIRTTTVLSIIGLVLGSVGFLIGFARPAAAAPSNFPTATQDCQHGGWKSFAAVHFQNQHKCVTWVRGVTVNGSCQTGNLVALQAHAPTAAAELGIPLDEFLNAKCAGSDLAISNNSFAVNDPAGTDLISLASGNTAPLVTKPGYIYWIDVEGTWDNGAGRQADAKYISDDAWATHANGPAFDQRNLEVQINDSFVDWGPYSTSHAYSYWIMGDGNPINLRVFDGDPATNTPNPAWYADNVGPVAGTGMSALVWEYALPKTQAATKGFPTTTSDCRHGGWKGFTGIDFRNQGQCVRWVRHYIAREDCLPGALADFQDSGARYAAQLGISLARFLDSVCHGQDFPVSNNSYVVNDPAGTDLVSLSSGNTAPFITQPGHIYWIEVQGTWDNGPTREADASHISDDGWATHAAGPGFNQLNLETQINDRFVDWGPYSITHNYSYWIMGDGNPINMRVFDGNPATHTPNPAWYSNNVNPEPGHGMPAIVFEYALATA